MLLGARWVINGDISDSSLSPQQVGTLSVDVHDWQGLVILKRVQSPPALGDTSFGGLVVLDDHPSECVCVFRQRPRQFKVGLLLWNRGLVCASKLLFLTLFAPLAVFPAPFIVLLSLRLLGRKRILFSVSVPAALSFPRSVCFPPAPPLPWLAVSPTSLVTATSMLLSLLDAVINFMFGDNRHKKTLISQEHFLNIMILAL